MKTEFFYHLNEDQKSEWLKFWQACRHTHPRQHHLFAEVEKVQGRTPVYIIGRQDGQISCLAIMSIRPLLFNKFSLEAVCLRGPAFDDVGCARQFIADIIAYFKALGVGRIRLSPYWLFPEAQPVEQMLAELGFTGLKCFSGGRSLTGTVSLMPSVDEIFASLKSKTRQEIRRTERLGVKIQSAAEISQARYFFDALNCLHHQRSLDVILADECHATFEHILRHGNIGTLLIASCDHSFLGGLWIIKGTHTCHYDRYVVIPEALRKLNNLTIGPALWWQGIIWAKQKGCTTLDVEGYEADLPSNHPKYHLCKLKSLFNPEPVQLLGQFQYVANPAVYALYQSCDYSVRAFNFARAIRYRAKAAWKEHKPRPMPQPLPEPQ